MSFGAPPNSLAMLKYSSAIYKKGLVSNSCKLSIMYFALATLKSGSANLKYKLAIMHFGLPKHKRFNDNMVYQPLPKNKRPSLRRPSFIRWNGQGQIKKTMIKECQTNKIE
jgi:hypothetical protein